MSEEGFAAALPNLSKRRWDILQERWRGYLPDQLEDMPAAHSSLSDEIVANERIGALTSFNEFVSVEDAAVIRTLIFENARFCIDRGLYFTRCSEKLAATNPTASLTTAYLGMIFGSRSIQGLLGVCYTFKENHTWMFDAWPGASESSSGGRIRQWDPYLLGFRSKLRIGHDPHWRLFIRLFAISTRLPVSSDVSGALRGLQRPIDFSGHRNGVQYNDEWPFDDLLSHTSLSNIGFLPVKLKVSPANVDMNIKMSQLLNFCATAMIFEILKPLGKYRNYIENFKARLAAANHPCMQSGALSGELMALLGPE